MTPVSMVFKWQVNLKNFEWFLEKKFKNLKKVSEIQNYLQKFLRNMKLEYEWRSHELNNFQSSS